MFLSYYRFNEIQNKNFAEALRSSFSNSVIQSVTLFIVFEKTFSLTATNTFFFAPIKSIENSLNGRGSSFQVNAAALYPRR